MVRERRNGSIISLLFMLVLMFFFLIVPLLKLMSTRFNSYFSFFPLFFFIPFFWSFSGRRRYLRSRHDQGTAEDSFEPHGTGINGNGMDGFGFAMPKPEFTPLHLAKYLAFVLVIALAAVLIYVFIL